MTRTLVTFLFALGICQASFFLGNAADGQEDSGYRLPQGKVEPTHYNVYLTPDLKNFTFEGSVEIVLNAIANTNEFKLNSKDLNIKKVTLVDVVTPVNKFVVSSSEDKVHEMLHIKLDKSLESKKSYKLAIEFSGTLNNDKRGFYRSRIMENGVEKGVVAVTHFEPTGARLAFPCWDEPNYKATFTISLTHASNLAAIANMAKVKSKVPQEDAKVITTEFEQTPRMSTYLVAFLVGDYVNVTKSDGDFEYSVWTKKVAINQTSYALEKGEKLLNALDDYMGIKYRNYIKKMDQVSLKDFSAGAMENWGLVTYRETALLYDELSTTTRSKMSILTVIAHEFAHQWFGNLVSPKWWKYIWLNEGFANYFQYFITHKVEPKLRLDEMFVVESMQGNAMVADANPLVRPMNKDVDTPAEISALFDSIAYQKAGSVIRMMCHALTEEVFKDGLHRYLNKHKLNNAESNDLFESLQQALADKKEPKWEKEVKEVMKEWVEKPGYPVLSVNRTDDGYQLSQEQFVIVLQQTERVPTTWWIPITYVEESNVDFDKTTPVFWLNKQSDLLKSDNKEKTGWFLFNTQQAGYYRVNYDAENWKLLTEALKTNLSNIHVVNRAQLIDDAMNMARVNRLDYKIALDLTLYLRNEADYMPWQPAFRHLSFLQNLLRDSDKYYTFKRYVEYLIKSLEEQVNYEPSENDIDLVKMLRVTTMKWACEVAVENCTAYAESEYNKWFANSGATKLDVDLKNEILCAGVRNVNVSLWSQTKKILETVEDEDERKAQMLPLACSNSTDILIEYLISTLHDESKIDLQTVAGHIVSRHPSGPQLVYDFVLKEYAKIQKLPNFKNVIKSVAETIAEGVTNTDQYLKLNAFLAENQLGVEATAKAAKNIMWVNTYRSKVDTWLEDNSPIFNSASSMTIASLLVIFSLFITRFY